LCSGDFEFSLNTIVNLLSENSLGNNLASVAEQILVNVKYIQQRNEIKNIVDELL
jgi:hypothetical protein